MAPGGPVYGSSRPRSGRDACKYMTSWRWGGSTGTLAQRSYWPNRPSFLGHTPCDGHLYPKKGTGWAECGLSGLRSTEHFSRPLRGRRDAFSGRHWQMIGDHRVPSMEKTSELIRGVCMLHLIIVTSFGDRQAATRGE
jgi:hypothetical protein